MQIIESRAYENPDEPVAVARARMVDRRALERKKADEDREAHLLAERVKAEERTAELDLLLEDATKLGKHFPAQIRMLAYQLVNNSDAGSMYAAQRQLLLDDKALDLARYVLTGKL